MLRQAAGKWNTTAQAFKASLTSLYVAGLGWGTAPFLQGHKGQDTEFRSCLKGCISQNVNKYTRLHTD